MTGRKADWVNVRYEDVSLSKNEKKHGVTVFFMTSPQDVPEMWRHGIQETPSKGHEAVFEFRYLASKEPSKFIEKDGVKLEVGKNSKRVYRIVIPLPLGVKNGDKIEVKIELAIEEIGVLERQGALRPANADVIQGMLRQPNLDIAQSAQPLDCNL